MKKLMIVLLLYSCSFSQVKSAFASIDSSRADTTAWQKNKKVIGREGARLIIKTGKIDSLESDSLSVNVSKTATATVTSSFVAAGLVDSIDINKVAPSNTDTGNAAWKWAGKNLAPVLGGQHEMTGRFKARGDSLAWTMDSQTYSNRRFYKVIYYNLADPATLAFPGLPGNPLDIWRMKEKHTSWYNEAASATRGAQREMPTRGIIGITSGQDSVIIYNADTGSMWMVFAPGANNMIYDATPVLTDIKFSDLKLCLSGTGGAALTITDFMKDNARLYNNTDFVVYGGNVSNRNAASAWGSYGSSPVIVNAAVNAVSVIRDPMGGIDSEGRAKHVVETMTAGGVSQSNAGISAFYDINVTTSYKFASVLSNGFALFLRDYTTEMPELKSYIQTTTADAWGVDWYFRDDQSGSSKYPWTSAIAFSGGTLVPGASLARSGDPVMVLGSNSGMLMSHLQNTGAGTSGLTWSIDATRNSPPWSGPTVGRSYALCDTIEAFGNNLSRSNATAITFGKTALGTAALFSGAAGVMTDTTHVGDYANGTTAFSVAFACSISSTTAAVNLVDLAKTAPVADTNRVFVGLTVTNSYLTFSAYDSIGGVKSITTAIAIDDAKWHTVSVTAAGTTGNYTLYLDGESVGTPTAASNKAVNPNKLYVGSDYLGTSRLTGGMADFPIFRRALTASEIRWFHQRMLRRIQSTVDPRDGLDTTAVAGVSGPVNGIVATWRSNGAGASDSTTLWDATYGLPIRRLPTPGGAIKWVELFSVGGQDSVGVIIAGATATRIYQPDVRPMDYATKMGPPSPPPDAWLPKHVTTPQDSMTWIEGGLTISSADSLYRFRDASPAGGVLRVGKAIDCRGIVYYVSASTRTADISEMIAEGPLAWIKKVLTVRADRQMFSIPPFIRTDSAIVIRDNDSTRVYGLVEARRGSVTETTYILGDWIRKGRTGNANTDTIRAQGIEIGDTVAYDVDTATVVKQLVVSVQGDTVRVANIVPARTKWRCFPPGLSVKYTGIGINPGDVCVMGTVANRFRGSNNTTVGWKGWIVSTDPSTIMNRDQIDGLPMAVAGTAPCNVSADSGAVGLGDALTAGAARRAVKITNFATQRILGYAMEAVASGVKIIKVIVE